MPLILKKPVAEKVILPDPRELIVNLREEGKPVWLEHATYRRRVDVVAIRLAVEIDAPMLSTPINKIEFDDYDLSVGDDAFVIGFPLDMHGGGHVFPIWKRASIATEPEVDLESLPKLLIDTATRQGMSGSPVIAVRRGIANKRGKGFTNETIIGEAKSFLGIYSSRIGDDPMGVQLGTVWKASVLEEIINGGVAGRGPHDPQ